MVTPADPNAARQSLPHGVTVRTLDAYVDDRGAIVELDRDSWHPDDPSPQWTLFATNAGVVKGGHVHKVHRDRLAVIEGELVIGLVDVRRQSPTGGSTAMFTLSQYEVVTIPAGVVHIFCSPDRTVALNGTSREFDPFDDLEVRYDDPDFRFAWPLDDPVLSTRDAQAPGLEEFLDRCRAGGLDVVSGMR
jgi:dTDP-4-dehydrorhamnose 3,5-epimerase